MHSFRDNAGRTWPVSIDVNAVKRIRDTCDFDPLKIDDGPAWRRFAEDPVLVVDALYATCRPECDARDISDEEFGRALVGDAIEEATAAFLEALADFFPSPAKRNLLRRALRWAQQETRNGERRIEEALANGEIDRLMDGAVRAASTPGGSSTNSPGSSGSTPVPAPSGN